jgi:molecular chaperone DnaK (HSP70)
MEVRKELSYMQTTLTSLPFNTPETACRRDNTRESFEKIIHPDLSRLREPSRITIKHTIRESSGEEIRKRRRH